MSPLLAGASSAPSPLKPFPAPGFSSSRDSVAGVVTLHPLPALRLVDHSHTAH